MKRYLLLAAAALFAWGGIAPAPASALDVVVQTGGPHRHHPPVVDRVWVKGHYKWHRWHYVWIPGHWEYPTH